MAARLGGRAGLLRRRTPSRATSRATSTTCSRCCRTPRATCTWATSSTTRWATSSRTSTPPGAAGAAADGLRLVRPAGRERGDPGGRSPARDHRARTSPTSARQMRRLGWAIDWDRVIAAHEPGVLPLDAVALPEVLREGPRVPQGGAGQLVPERPDRPRERAGDRRALRALRRRGRGSQHGAVVLPDHGLRGRAAGRSRADRLARAHEDDPAQLDRPLRGRRAPVPHRGAGRRRARLHDAARHDLRRDVLRARARAPLVDTLVERSPNADEVREYVRRTMAKRGEERAAAEEKTGVFTGFYATNPATDERDSRSGSPTTC